VAAAASAGSVPAAAGAEETIRAELRGLFAPEDRVVVDARARAGDARPVSPEEGALLRWLAGRMPHDGVSDVVEVGAGGGVGALHLIPALPETATLTIVEPDTDAHALASEALEVAGHGDRVRAILGDPSEVLPRLADGRYGMCVLQVSPARYAALLEDVLRLLAPDGLLVVRGVLRRGEHGQALARLLAAVATDERLDATVLHEHDGLLLVTRR
jgi:predicted O-methyltransferase YrrM